MYLREINMRNGPRAALLSILVVLMGGALVATSGPALAWPWSSPPSTATTTVVWGNLRCDDVVSMQGFDGYPARLTLTYNGSTHEFDFPKKPMKNSVYEKPSFALYRAQVQ